MNRTQKLGNVLIISSRKRMLSEFQSYLHSVLGEYLTFNTLLREQATDPSLFRGYQCVLFPSVRAMETFPLTLDSSILQLPCDRVFNHMFLDKIIQIPPHERVYLVNDDKYSTLAIISQLEECGITQYDFVPFYPGCKDTESDIQFAITAGEPQLVPSRIPNVLDIGNRIIDISTILQLCEYFNIPLQTVNRVSRNYVNQILHTVKTSETYYTNYVQTEQLMQVILFSLPIGICLFGADRRDDCSGMPVPDAADFPAPEFLRSIRHRISRQSPYSGIPSHPSGHAAFRLSNRDPSHPQCRTSKSAEKFRRFSQSSEPSLSILPAADKPSALPQHGIRKTSGGDTSKT